MFDLTIFYAFFAISLINMLHLGFYLVGANVYDVMHFRKQRKALTDKGGKPYQPLVSIMVPAHNEEAAIERCLESVSASTYGRFEIIVMNDASHDGTRKQVMRHIRTAKDRYTQTEIIDVNKQDHLTDRGKIRSNIQLHRGVTRKCTLTLVNLKKNVGKARALNYGIQHVASGDLIMTLDGDSLLHPQAIERAVAYFRDPKIVGVAANVRIIDSMSILGLLQKFEHMIGYRSKKFYSLTNTEYIIGGVASTYRASTLNKVGYYDHDTITEDIGLSMKIVSQGNRDQRVVYAADVAAMTEGTHTFKELFRQRYRWKMGSLQNLFKYKSLFGKRGSAYSPLLTFYRIPMAFLGEIMVLLEFLLLLYIFATAIIMRNPGQFAGAYLMISTYILLSLLPDEHMTLKDKLRMTGYVPVLYFIFFIMNAVQVTSALRCIANYKQFTRRENVNVLWVSPKRLGAAVKAV